MGDSFDLFPSSVLCEEQNLEEQKWRGEKRDLLASEVVGMGLFCLKNHRVGCCQQPLRVSPLTEEPKIHEDFTQELSGMFDEVFMVWFGVD